MKKLKWFSGGNARAEQAIQLIDELLRDLDDSSSHSDRLRTVLRRGLNSQASSCSIYFKPHESRNL